MPIIGSLGGSSSSSFGRIISSFKKSFFVQYLVIAGGGGASGGSTGSGGGAGAGGYRSSVSGESSGGGASAEPKISVFSGGTYSVVVGGGGSGSNGGIAQNGSNSVFSQITSLGGGRSGARYSSGGSGGSGGGGGAGLYGSPGIGGPGTSQQGFAGATGGTGFGGGGGGGAGAAAITNPNPDYGGAGGNGISSSITGTSVTRGGGGGGGSDLGAGPGAGGTGGGGTGRAGAGLGGSGPTPGAVNTGGGGGGGAGAGAGANGGSGIVIVSYPISYTPTFSVGVTQTTNAVNGNRVSTITATSTTSETVSFTQTPPAGYTLGANGKYYKYYSTAQSFSVAQSTCNSEGGWIAVPLNLADNSAIRNAALSASPVSVWLGITDTASEGTWRITSSGHPLNGKNAPYFNWNSGEPNNSGDEDYVEMYISGASTGLWNDANLSSNRVFVGEWYVPNPEITSLSLSQENARVGVPTNSYVTYFGQPSPSISYQWQRAFFEGATWNNLSGAVGSSYTPTSSDLGSFIRVVVTATNTAGSFVQESESKEVMGANLGPA